MNNKSFLIRIATRFDYNLIRYGLKRFHWPLEPLSLTIQNHKIPSFLEYKWTMTQVLNGHNLIGFDENNLMNNFIGFVVNTKWTEMHTKEMRQLADSTKDDRLLTLATIHEHIEMVTNIYKEFNIKELFLINNIGVHPDYYRKKVGSQLIQQSLERANGLGFKMAVLNATGEHLKGICEKSGMTQIATIKYTDVLDKDNKRIFQHHADDEIYVFIQKFRKYGTLQYDDDN